MAKEVSIKIRLNPDGGVEVESYLPNMGAYHRRKIVEALIGIANIIMAEDAYGPTV